MIDVLRRQMIRKTIKRTDKIILLSVNSEEAFRKEYKTENTVVFRLPAHAPEAVPQKPSEIAGEKRNFFLFFGRIDKYKGIGTLCKAYSALTEDLKEKNELIIAGKGQLSEEELSLIQSERHIIPITRFITDGEMVWLFQNSLSVIMPYIEASQSGVLPIAYKFGKPVVVSDLQGLTENVLEEKTGYVFRTVEELTEILRRFGCADIPIQKEAIDEYYRDNFLWKNNLEKLFRVILCKSKDE